MTKIIKLSMAVLMGSSLLYSSTEMMKKYEVKSGKIEYEIKGSGNVMGMVEMKTIGKRKVIFDAYGEKNLIEENKVTKETAMGQTKVNKEHSINYMDGDMLYRVDFEQKKIMRMKNPAMAMIKMMGGEKNMEKMGKSMMEKMGGKKVGTDKVLGYTCDVWDMMGVKQCIYKGIPLRLESNIMGMKNTEIATKADFDISIKKDDFKLPDFPMSDMEGGFMGGDKSMDRGMKHAPSSPEDMEKAMKAMGAMMGAMKESGMDMSKPNVNMSEEQAKAMKNAMMNAMGGEKSMLAQAKQEILEDAKMLPQARKCFKKANSAKDANACERLVDSEDPEYHTKWDDTTKTSLLKEMDAFENAIPCLKNAKTMKALQMCMPE